MQILKESLPFEGCTFFLSFCSSFLFPFHLSFLLFFIKYLLSICYTAGSMLRSGGTRWTQQTALNLCSLRSSLRAAGHTNKQRGIRAGLCFPETGGQGGPCWVKSAGNQRLNFIDLQGDCPVQGEARARCRGRGALSSVRELVKASLSRGSE